MQTEALPASSDTTTRPEHINVFGEKNKRTPEGSRIKMYIGICNWCKEWGELVHTRNFFGDSISICKNCLKHPGDSRRKVT